VIVIYMLRNRKSRIREIQFLINVLVIVIVNKKYGHREKENGKKGKMDLN